VVTDGRDRATADGCYARAGVVIGEHSARVVTDERDRAKADDYAGVVIVIGMLLV
jgi:hypothetical protein